MINMEQESFIQEMIESGNNTIEKLISSTQYILNNQPEYKEFLLPLVELLKNKPNLFEYML